MLHRLFYLVLLLTLSLVSIAQNQLNIDKKQWVSLQTGLLAESFSPRIALEYQQEISEKWLWGVAADISAIRSPWVQYDEPIGGLPNPSYFTLNIYRKLSIIGDRWFYNFGLGGGAGLRNGIKPVVTVSMTMNVRLAKKLYLELPIFLFPAMNRYYGVFDFAGGSLNMPDHDVIVLPFGLRYQF